MINKILYDVVNALCAFTKPRPGPRDRHHTHNFGCRFFILLGVKFLQPKTLITLSPKFDAHL
jgi:hypothetical protein